jgi:hypothetical protein
LYHSILVNALLGRKFGNGLANGDKEHNPRVGERRFVGRNANRVDAMHTKRSITSSSTVRYSGLSTSTMGSPVGMPQAPGWLAQPEAKLRELTGICFTCRTRRQGS